MKKIYEAPTSELIYIASCDIITVSIPGEDVAEDVTTGDTADVGGN